MNQTVHQKLADEASPLSVACQASVGLDLDWPSELSAGIKWAWKLLRGSVID